MTFLSEHLLLILTITGAALSFLATLMGLRADRKPVMVLAVLTTVGFVVGITYQVESARRAIAGAQITAAAEAAKNQILGEIRTRVADTQVTVKDIAERLRTRSWAEVGTELVTIQATGPDRFEEVAAFSKGSPQEWARFAAWQEQVGRTGAATSLALTLGAGNHYDSRLLLAYLLTCPASRPLIQPVIDQPSAWSAFPGEAAYLECFSRQAPHLKALLVYRQPSTELVAFADAQAFTQQLLAYHRLGQHARVDQALNGGLEPLRQLFPMVQTGVFKARDPSELVGAMIERQLPVAVTTTAGKPYFARLEQMVRLATR